LNAIALTYLMLLKGKMLETKAAFLPYAAVSPRGEQVFGSAFNPYLGKIVRAGGCHDRTLPTVDTDVPCF
jgi:hypothetical protein